jgi:hypothetical protein
MALFIVVFRAGLLVAVLEIEDPVIWPYDWNTFTYCFADPREPLNLGFHNRFMDQALIV